MAGRGSMMVEAKPNESKLGTAVSVTNYGDLPSYMHPPNRICGEVKTQISFTVEHTEEAFVNVYMEEYETVTTKDMSNEMSIVDDAIDTYLSNKENNRNIQEREDYISSASSKDQTDTMAVSAKVEASANVLGLGGASASAEGSYSHDHSVKTTSNKVNQAISRSDIARQTENESDLKVKNYKKNESGGSIEYSKITHKKDKRKFNPNFTQIYRITKFDAKITHRGSGRTLGHFTDTQKIYKDSQSTKDHETAESLRERSLTYAKDHFGINSVSGHIQISVINNCVNGRVIYYYPNGDMYRGEFKNGKRHGWGLQKFNNGGSYEGYWVDDEIDSNRVEAAGFTTDTDKSMIKLSELVNNQEVLAEENLALKKKIAENYANIDLHRGQIDVLQKFVDNVNGSVYDKTSSTYGLDNSPFVINKNDYIYRGVASSDKAQSIKWTKLNGGLKDIGCNSDLICWGVNVNGYVYYADASSVSSSYVKWVKKSASFKGKSISTGRDGAVWVTDTNHRIWRASTINSSWSEVHGSLTDVAVINYDKAWGVNKESDLCYYDGHTFITSYPFKTGFKKVAVCETDDIYAVATNGGIWWYTTSKGWEKFDGWAADVACKNNRAYVIGGSESIWVRAEFDSNRGTYWNRIAGGAVRIG